MIAERVDVINVQRGAVRELPSDTGSGVDGVGLNEIVRNHRSKLSRTACGNEAVQAPSAKHCVDIWVMAKQRLIGNAHDTATELIHRTELKPRTVAGHIQ